MACHSFWLVLLGPLGLYLAYILPVGIVRGVAVVMIILAATAIGGVAFWQVQVWLPNIDEGQPTYFVERVLYVTATLVEFPILEVLLLALGMIASTLLIHRRRDESEKGNQLSVKNETSPPMFDTDASSVQN